MASAHAATASTLRATTNTHPRSANTRACTTTPALHQGPPSSSPGQARALVCEKLAAWLQSHGQRLLIVCVGGMHVHLLAELPGNPDEAKAVVGVAKKTASQAVSAQVVGRVWARGCGLKPIRDEAHQHNTYRYIERHADDGAAAWTFRDGEA